MDTTGSTHSGRLRFFFVRRQALHRLRSVEVFARVCAAPSERRDGRSPAAGPAALSHGLTRRQRQVQLPRFSTARPPPRKPAQETSVPLQQRTPPIPRTPLESNNQGGVHAERAEHSSAGAQAGPRLNEVTVYKKEPARQEMPRRFQSVSERPRNPTERRRRPLAASARSRYPPW